MQLFKNGGTCATPMTLTQRNQARIKSVIRSMGDKYLLHPENKGATWRAGN